MKEKSLDWNFLKIVKDTLDSYRIRALIDAKEDIISREIYSEEEYYDLLFTMFDLEKLKYELYEFIKKNPVQNLDSLKDFAQSNSIKLELVFYLLELLSHEKLVNIEKHFINDDNDNAHLEKFKVNALKIDKNLTQYPAKQ